MSRKLTADEKRSRRRERLRLQAYLRKGGRLVSEDLPAGQKAWCRLSRLGHPFSDRCVSRVIKTGHFTLSGAVFVIMETEEGHIMVADFV